MSVSFVFARSLAVATFLGPTAVPPSSPLQRTLLIVGHPHGSACVEPRSAGGEEGLSWGHPLSLITNTVANSSAVEAVA